jgi:hypothetical protein
MKKLFVVLLVLGCALLMSTPALADACTVADEFCLINSNENQFSPGQITVHIDLTGNTLTVTAHGDAGFVLKGIDSIAVNATNGTGGNLFGAGATLPGTWGADATPNSDGFSGTFGSGASDPGGTDTTVVFTLNGAPVYAAGEDPTWVVHIRYNFGDNTNCSAFISNQATPGGAPQGDGLCGGTEIPEPGSLALLGTGLFSAVGVLRRKLLKT